MLLSLGAAALSAFAVVISTTAVVKLQKQEVLDTNEALEKYKLDAGAKMAEANARTKEAELKLAELLDKKITPRVIRDEGAAEIVEKISSFSGTPFTVESDPAAEYGFVNRVIELLQKGGWKLRNPLISRTA